MMLKRCVQNRTFIISVIILLPILIVALIGPLVITRDPLEINGSCILQPYAPGHPLGTDNFGRDILSRLIIGIRPTLLVALGATALAYAGGLCFGIVAGYFGKVVEQIIMRIIDIVLCFPPILLAMMVVAFWGSGVINLVVAIGILYMPHFARIAYSSTLQVRKLEHVESEISLGATHYRILVKNILPNIMSPMIIQISLTIAAAILLESGLSFLGIGIVPPTPSWGQMIGEAKGYITIAPMYALWPSLCLCATILGVNLLGDSLRDILDPKTKS
ncbi:ABC transporter permease [Petroclostridium sp. X23]|uniref:ABC transporter permease n=1 Tax=Petroclostridium sp. X23 TaxID=3045146 RepID=UPI0024ADC1E7|nr:ABC transporter permease [Petroclostridium sp. X23]WHH60104.1 ABC transporter permease [Petroclostridium sp. X23]